MKQFIRHNTQGNKNTKHNFKIEQMNCFEQTKMF